MLAKPMWRLLRPAHWAKNVVVLMPVVFGQQMGQTKAWIAAVIASIAFCLASSCSYIFNDLKDRGKDRIHPLKKSRPLASGQVTIRLAVIESVICGFFALVLASSLSYAMVLMVLAFLGLHIAYTLLLKNLVLLDVICIALGFVLRAAAGAVAIGVFVSPWLFICMFTICLFMGFCKRYSEIAIIQHVNTAQNHRSTLIEYTPELLTHLVTLSAGIAVVAFLFYGLSDSTVEQFGTNYLVYTLPVTVYAIFRFAMVSMKGSYQDPTDLIWHDRPFQAAIFIWMSMVLLIVKYGRTLEGWLESLG